MSSRERLILLVVDPAVVLGLGALVLHLWANGAYGVFRDELYYIVCGHRLAWGYVDQPPLAPLVAALSWDAFGGSLRGLRLVPACTAAALVALTVATARYLGGGRYAAWLAGLCVLAGGVLQTTGLLMITDTLQPLAWLGCSYAMIRAQRDGRPRWWWIAGAGAGVAFLWKYTIAFHLAALGAGLLLTPQRRLLARRDAWLALVLAALIALPNLAWQAAHGWPFLEHGRVLAAKTKRMPPLHFLGQQVLLLDPFTAPVWMAGLAAFAGWRRFADLRWVAIGWVLLVAVMVAAHGKPYYIAGAYPLLFAGGAVALKVWLSAAAPRIALAGLVVAGGLVTMPLALPVLPVAVLAAYLRQLGTVPSTGERLELGALPQIYADMFGWRAMAEAVARAYAALPPEDQARAVFLGRNYGEAAAIDVFGPALGLPPAISAHETYFLWGPRGHDGSVVLQVGGTRERLLRTYAAVEQVGWLDEPWALPTETGIAVWVCRGRKTDLRNDWTALKHYD